jgi:hypothetical protein
MFRPFCVLLWLCFLISTICAPGGDFSLLSQLPVLYEHCKSAEDPDMNLLDFITDHLLNIDGIFDKHLPGDDQKPHQPFQFQHFQHVFEYVSAYLQINVATPVFPLKKIKISRPIGFHSDYIVYFFHPPNSYLNYQAA